MFVLQHQSQKRLWLALGLFLLAIGSKESAVVWICVALFLDVASRKIDLKSFLMTYPLYIAAGSAWFSWHHFLTKGMTSKPFSASNPLAGSEIWERLSTISHAQVRYIQNLFFPESLVTNYHYPLVHVVSWTDLRAIIGIILLLICSTFLLKNRNWGNKLGQSIVCFGGCQAPTASVFGIVGPLIAERLVYPSSVFFSIAVALLLYAMWHKFEKRAFRTSLVMAVGTWVMVQATAFGIRLSYWSDGLTYSRQGAISASRSVDAAYLYAKHAKIFNLPLSEQDSATKNLLLLDPNSQRNIQLRGQYLLEAATSSQHELVCEGYSLLYKAYLIGPLTAVLPTLVTSLPGFKKRLPKTIFQEMQECGIKMSPHEAKYLDVARKSLLNTRGIEVKGAEASRCNAFCRAAQSYLDNDLESAAKYFEESYLDDPGRGNIRAFLLALAFSQRLLKPSRDIFLGRVDFDNEWNKYCESIGYTPSDSCRETFKLGLDGTPWYKSPLKKMLGAEK